jgi:LuxR family quorum-sensing system transcriptional regulator CciR
MSFLALADSVIRALRAAATPHELRAVMEAITRDFGFHHFALIHHDDLRVPRADRVDLKDYPAAITERLIGQLKYRRDPIIRGCCFAGGAFLWSDLHHIISFDRRDRASFEYGARAGLNEGITVPYALLGECMGSCTFAGTGQPERAGRFLGPAQMIGVFAFQAARRLLAMPPAGPISVPHLHPRPRDCVILAGQGRSNKEIARALGLTPRTVDGYLTEAKALFGAHGRTEVVIDALLAGEIGLHELKRQPE